MTTQLELTHACTHPDCRMYHKPVQFFGVGCNHCGWPLSRLTSLPLTQAEVDLMRTRLNADREAWSDEIVVAYYETYYGLLRVHGGMPKTAGASIPVQETR